MKYLWLFGLVGVVGCDSSPSFKIKNASCDVDFTEWYPDLTFHVLQGGADGVFDYEPGGSALNGIVGSYDLTNGDFSWDETYNENHYLEGKSVTGYGYANVNGDLDIVGTESYADVAGAKWEIQFRMNRVGCEVDNRRQYYNNGTLLERVETGSFESGQYSYVRSTDQGGYATTEEGYINENLDYSNTESTKTSGYAYYATTTGNLATGDSVESFLQESDGNGSDVEFEGTISRGFDGGRAVKYDVRRPGENTGIWDYELDYFGTGSGTYSSGNLTCDIEYDRGQCTYDCGGGNSGSCS